MSAKLLLCGNIRDIVPGRNSPHRSDGILRTSSNAVPELREVLSFSINLATIRNCTTSPVIFQQGGGRRIVTRLREYATRGYHRRGGRDVL
jgi:hypothetical protein